MPAAYGSERCLARFDADTGRLWRLESMRYRVQDHECKTLWLNEMRSWDDVGGNMVPSPAALTWFDECSPWTTWHVDEVVYGTDVSGFLGDQGL